MNAPPEIKFFSGFDPEAICETYGSPVYVYDSEVILRQLEIFRTAFAELPHRVLYAAKALSPVEVLRLLKEEGTGLDAVSVQEIELGLRAGFTPRDILFTPSFPSETDLDLAVELGARINIDNFGALEKFSGRHGDVPCCLRLKPAVMAKDDTARWYEESKFGLSMQELEKAAKLVQEGALRVEGLHVHSSSVILDADVFTAAAKALFEAAERFPSLEYLDFGGGIKVPHREEDHVVNLAELAGRLAPAYSDFSRIYGRKPELWFEPGRFLVSEAGLLLTRVTGLKKNGDEVLAGVDTGFNHLLRPRLYGAWHEITNFSNPGGKPTEYRIVGQLCEPDDLAVERTLPEIREGDLLGFHNAGAYGASMASNYNSRPRPAEILLQDGEARLIRRRETLDDLLGTQPGA
ncbi:MAG: diaminopimelate decarboxylase [Planctomycetota bacterium]|nr:diaminopimelate decarboxylase [Planctomycetota bacterium]